MFHCCGKPSGLSGLGNARLRLTQWCPQGQLTDASMWGLFPEFVAGSESQVELEQCVQGGL